MGSTAEFEKLFDAHANEILRYIGLKVNDRYSVEDISASTFLKFWERYKGGENIHNPRALLYTIARGLIVDLYRKNARQMTTSLDMLENVFDIESDDDIVAPIDKRLDMKNVLEHMAGLKDEYREVILLHYVQGLGVPECAAITEQTENAFRVTLHRALTRLRETMNHD